MSQMATNMFPKCHKIFYEEHLISSQTFWALHVAQSLPVKSFVDIIVCPLTYSFRLTLWSLQTFLNPVDPNNCHQFHQNQQKGAPGPFLPSWVPFGLAYLLYHTLQPVIWTTDAIGNSDHIYVTRNHR
jgi:hypothetical protein